MDYSVIEARTLAHLLDPVIERMANEFADTFLREMFYGTEASQRGGISPAVD